MRKLTSEQLKAIHLHNMAVLLKADVVGGKVYCDGFEVTMPDAKTFRVVTAWGASGTVPAGGENPSDDVRAFVNAAGK